MMFSIKLIVISLLFGSLNPVTAIWPAKIQYYWVTGNLTCEEHPYNQGYVAVWEYDIFDRDDLLGITKLNADGSFEVGGWKAEIGKISPYVYIYHRCGHMDLKPNCYWVESIPASSQYISFVDDYGEHGDKSKDFGTIELFDFIDKKREYYSSSKRCDAKELEDKLIIWPRTISEIIKMAQRTIYKWPILKFSKITSRDDLTLFLQSEPFTLIGTNFKFRLRFEPTNMIEGESKQHCAVYLVPSDLGEAKSVKLDLKFWIENTDGDRLVRPEIGMVTHTFNEIGWGFYNFVHHDKLYSPKSTFIKHDTVFICCAILYKPSIPSDDIQRLATEIDKKEWTLYEEGFTGPCTIEVGDQKFEVDKKKLMAHSIVFDRMLKSGMKEAQTGIITLNNTTPIIIQALVKYMHVHEIEDMDEEVSELYLLADKYEIVDLKEKCSQILIGNLDKDNIFDRLIMAFRHNDKAFKQSVLDYLADRPGSFKEIMKSTEWAEFITDNMQLSREIIDEAFKSISWF